MKNDKIVDNVNETATLGAGCFWCVEAIFQKLEGIISVVPGYSGGFVKNPSYKEVCTGKTGHAEVCRIQFDSGKISFAEILMVYWQTHDPTTPNRQGNDIGEQYRSVIFYHNEMQQKIAEDLKEQLNEDKIWDDPVITEIVPLENFYLAEDYHHNYYKNNSDQPYCSLVITPKIEKFKKSFAEKLK
jgi:peptide-methionine (S)-S-oxide reductase